MQDVQHLSKRAGQYLQLEDAGKQTIPDPFLRQLVQGSNQAKLRKLHAELVAGADEAELSLTKRSQTLQESLAALLQAFDAGEAAVHGHVCAMHYTISFASPYASMAASVSKTSPQPHVLGLQPQHQHRTTLHQCSCCCINTHACASELTPLHHSGHTLLQSEAGTQTPWPQLAASSTEAHPPTAAAAAAAAEAARAQQGTQRELDCQLALNRTIHAQLKQADDLLARSEAGERQLRNELADQAELLASTKRKLALLSQSQGQGQGQGGLQPLGRQGSLVKAPEGAAELQKVLDRRGEELELERANSILLQRCMLPGLGWA